MSFKSINSFLVCLLAVTLLFICLTSIVHADYAITLTNGDINGDNGVDETDYALMTGDAWYTSEEDEDYNKDADLNGDGGIDEIDYAILSNSWYEGGRCRV